MGFLFFFSQLCEKSLRTLQRRRRKWFFSDVVGDSDGGSDGDGDFDGDGADDGDGGAVDGDNGRVFGTLLIDCA